MASPSFHERFAPKALTMIMTMINGINMPTTPCVSATSEVIRRKYSSHEEPCATSCSVMPALLTPPETPTTIGVPTAPKETGVDCIIIPTTTAASAGKPRTTISGAATAAGVPKPEAPSIKQPNSHATISACTRLSGLMSVNPLRIAVIPPECFKVLSSKMAPKIIHRMEAVRIRPCRAEATTRLTLICHAVRAITVVTMNTIGMTTLAVILNPINSTPARISGRNASSASAVLLIFVAPLVLQIIFPERCTFQRV